MRGEGRAPKSYIFRRLLCRNSPYSRALGSSRCTSCSTSGRRVTMPVPRGRKSLPTTASSTELLPELCGARGRQLAGQQCLLLAARALLRLPRSRSLPLQLRRALQRPRSADARLVGGAAGCAAGRHLAPDNHDAGQQLPQARQGLVAGSIVPELGGRRLQPVDELDDAVHARGPAPRSALHPSCASGCPSHRNRPQCLCSLTPSPASFNWLPTQACKAGRSTAWPHRALGHCPEHQLTP